MQTQRFSMMRNFGAAVQRPSVEGGRIKVTDNMIWLNVIPPDGVPRRYGSFSGESLLAVLSRQRTPGIFCKYIYSLLIIILIADDGGGDKENSMQPHQIPYDFYSAGVGSA